MAKEKKFRWVASSDDGAFNDESAERFATKEECYNAMRNAALEKMKWNTEYSEDLGGDELNNADGCEIEYRVIFAPDEIIHHSYSGTYTYKIVECEEEIMRFTLDFDVRGKDKATMNRIQACIKEALLSGISDSSHIAFLMGECEFNEIRLNQNIQVQHIR